MRNIDYDLEYNNAIDKMARGGKLEASFKINTPTGATSKLTYIQQLLVRTKAFKEWFGDWESLANRIVQDRAKETPISQVEKTLVKSFWQNDKSKGNLSRNQIILSFYFLEYKIKDVSHTIDYDTLEPQPYWHGTQAEEFFEFKTNVRVTGRPYSYFALNKSYSEQFSQGKTLYSVFTCIKNPYIYINYKLDKGFAFLSEVFIDYGLKNNLDSAQIQQLAKDTKYKYVKDYLFDKFGIDNNVQFWRLMSRDNQGEFKSFLQSLGYDGVMYVEEIREDADITQADEFTRAVTIFEPNQVKLADGRNTEFSALTNDIRYDEGGEINKNFTPIFKWRMMDIRQEDGSIKEVPMHDFFLWIYDDVEAEQKLKDGVYEYPYPTIQFNDDLEAIWKDNKFKKYKGNKHIISFIYGTVDEYFQKEGYYNMEIDVMTTKPNFRRQGVNEFAIKYLREKFKLDKEQVKFELPTEQGKLFVSSGKYEKGGLIAPNGKKSNLTPEQYKLVRTPEFKKWFGDWENDPKNASQVVDENGEPKVMYRGNPKEQEDLGYIFNLGYNFLNKKNENQFGFFFTDDIDVAKKYMKVSIWGEIEGGSITQVFLNIKNLFDLTPLDLFADGITFSDYLVSNGLNIVGYEELIKEIREYNYYENQEQPNIYNFFDKFPSLNKLFIFNKINGVIFKEKSRNYFSYSPYVVFHPNQIKLADGTNTTFDNESNDIRYAEGGEVNFDKIISSSSRFKPSDTIVFDPPLLGKNGTKLVAYQWKYTIESSFNKEGEEYGKRVSDWTQAEESAETGRDLVHVFDVEMPDGSKKSVSSETVLSIMGFVDKDTKKVFGNLATASKTLAKQQMKLAILEAQQKQYDEAKREFENIKKPTIKIAKLNELPLVIQKTIEKESDRIYFSMGDVVRPQDLPYNQYVLFKDLDNLDENKYKPTKNTIDDLESTWIWKRLNANNIKAPYGLYDLKNRVQRQKNKVEKMLSSDNKYAEGGKTKMNRYSHLHGMFGQETQKFAIGGSVATEHGLTNSGKKGGYFEGRSHAEGGIKAWNTTTNSPLEVEGGEVIITKKAVDDDELYEFEGEQLTNKQILSKINESGGGVKFEDGGEIHQCNCSGKMYKYGGETMEDYQIMNRINSTYNKKQGMKNHKTSYGHNLMRKMKEGGYC